MLSLARAGLWCLGQGHKPRKAGLVSLPSGAEKLGVTGGWRCWWHGWNLRPPTMKGWGTCQPGHPHHSLCVGCPGLGEVEGGILLLRWKWRPRSLWVGVGRRGLCSTLGPAGLLSAVSPGCVPVPWVTQFPFWVAEAPLAGFPGGDCLAPPLNWRGTFLGPSRCSLETVQVMGTLVSSRGQCVPGPPSLFPGLP